MKIHSAASATMTLLWAVAPLCAQVRVGMESITLPTYAEGPPDLTPSFGKDYPYPPRNALTDERNDESWRVIVLENEFLRCRFLPDLAGRLYGCTDKRNRREMFFANSSIREGPEGLRGAWIAAGVEPSFPVGHTRDAVSPVDFAFGRGADGSASVTTGSIDRITGMRWQTRFTLHPGETVVEERVTLSNPTAVPHPYYWWNDAAFAWNGRGTRFVLPTHLVETHNGADIEPWPMNDKGADIGIVANNPEQTAWFAYGSKEPFEAVYEPALRSATVHVADPAVLTGKKIFIWGTQGDEAVRHTLTDDGSTYIEMQAGLFENQETWRMLAPHQTRSFTEYWIPVHDLGGVSRAVREAVVSLRPSSGSLTVSVEATQTIKAAQIRVTQGDHILLDEKADLEPTHAWSRDVPGFAAGAACRFELHDGGGVLLLAHELSPDGKDVYDALTADRVTLGPQLKPARVTPSTADEFLEAGKGYELKTQPGKALAEYEKGLSKFPDSAPLHLARGRVLLALFRFAEAARGLSWCRDHAPDDLALRYELGVALAREGDDTGAEPELRAALADKTVGGAAAFELAGLLSRQGQLNEAAARFDGLRQQDLAACVSEVAVRRHEGKADAARQLAAGCIARSPQDSMLRVEITRLGAHDDSLWIHLGANAERVLDLAERYLFLGFTDDALALLAREYPVSLPNQTELGSVLPQQNALVAYYRAYCRSVLGQPFDDDLNAAPSLTMAYVFPHRAADWTVIEWAVKNAPGDGGAHLLLGYLYRFAEEAPQARREWQRALALRPALPGLAALVSANELAHVSTAGASAATAPSGGDPHAIAAAALLRSLDNLEAALRVFNESNFPDEKQEEFVRRAWLELQLGRVRSMTRAGDCAKALPALDSMGDEVDAVPFTIRGFGFALKEPRVQFYQAQVEDRCGREKAGHKRLEHIERQKTQDADPFPILAAIELHEPDGRDNAEAAIKRPATTGAQLYARGMLLKALGRDVEARSAFDEGARVTEDDFVRYLNLSALTDLRRKSF